MRVLFIGSKSLGLRLVTEMCRYQAPMAVVTIDDRDDTRSVFNDLQKLAAEKNLPFHVARNRKHSEELFRELRPDLCFAGYWYWLISGELVQSVPYIGMHPSLLPRLRGGSPLVWAMITGDTTVGFSFFSLTAAMDDGPIWAQESIEVGPDEYIGDVLKRFEAKAAETMRELYPAVLNGQAKPREQDHSRATYCVMRLPTDGLIDWSQSAERVFNFIRAQSYPYPGAYTYMGEKPVKVWRARRFDGTYYGMPGQVAQLGSDGVTVTCGANSAIILEEVQAGDSKQPAVNVIKSIKTRFGFKAALQ